MRILASALMVVFLAADVAMEERTELISGEPFAMDRGPLDHLGWGTLEDVHVDLGGGAAVSVFSGNLVVSARPFVRADVLADSQLALTYNHLDPDGHPELGPGWTYDLGRYTAPGAWGDRVLVDADGARDDFFAGEPPDNDEVRAVVDELVRAWKKDTPRRERREVGGDAAMRSMLGADPLFLGEMRLRYLGPAAAPEVFAGEELIWRSSKRGERALLQGDGEIFLTRPDGGRERYSVEGVLTTIEPPGGPVIQLARESGRLTGVSYGRSERFRVSSDSWGRFRTIHSDEGADAEFVYAGRSLWKLNAPGGDWRFEYDARGRLASIDGPDGRVTVRYDDATGRVAEAVGPGASVSLGVLDGDAVATVVATVDGAALTCTWDPRARVRGISGGGVSQTVRFAGGRPLPVEVSDGATTFRFRWDDGGRLLEAATEGVSARWERDAQGRVAALVDTGGRRGSIEVGGDGRPLGWSDPEGRSTALVLDASGRPTRIDRPGGLSETIWRTETGTVKSVSTTGGESIDLRRDGRGFVRRVESVVSGSAGVKVDKRGRVVEFEAPSGGSATVRRGLAGRLTDASDPWTRFDLRYRGALLDSWTGPDGGARVTRDEEGLPVRLEGVGGLGWELDRDRAGWPQVLHRAGRPDVRFDYDGGLVTGWRRTDGHSFALLRDRGSARVTGWETAGGGRIELDRDASGQTAGMLRGSGRWTLGRDRGGRIRRVANPAGGTAEIQVDGGGRPSVLSTGEGHRFVLGHGPQGRLTELRGRRGVGWKLTLDRGGRVGSVGDPEGRLAELRWDRASRWTELAIPGTAMIEAGWASAGPSRAAGLRTMLDPDGAMTGWGPQGELGGWAVQADASGRATEVRFAEGSGARGRRATATPVAITRGTGGVVERVDGWAPRWNQGRIEGLSAAVGGATATWSLRVDGQGRVRGIDGPDGASAEVTFDRFGDVRDVRVGSGEGGATWAVERDPAGQVEEVSGPGDLTWVLERDAAGRVRGWTAGDRRATFAPTDGSIFTPDDSLADALGVTTDDPAALVTRPSGSRQVTLGLVDGPDVVTLEEVRGIAGALASVDGFWGSTATPVLDESPLLEVVLEPGAADDPMPSLDESSAPSGGADDPPPPYDDPIAAAFDAPALGLGWAGATLRSADGGVFLPAPDGRGAGASANGWIRVAADDGGTLTWVGPGSAINGLRLPGPFGGWTTPEGWLGYPAPPGALDPPTVAPPSDPPGPGDVRAVGLWWSGLGVGEEGLARLPLAVLGPDPRAWLAPRSATFAASSRVPLTAPPHAGGGASVPPVPGARRLLPSMPGVAPTTPLRALVLGGDLPPDAEGHRRFVDLPTPAWTVDVPGAAILHDVVGRRANPALPPGWRAEALAGLAPGLDGFLTADGARRLDQPLSAPRAAVEGLPLGTADVLPGLCEDLPGAFGSLPIDARCSSLEGLADHPVVPGAWRRQGVEDDALLLALPGLEPRGPSALGGWLEPAAATESWVLETPAGTRFAVDRRGRLLSADLGGRLRRAAGRRVVAFAGRALLEAGRPDARPADVAPLGAPVYVPQAGDVPETRWGLAPGDPRFPLGARGEPLLRLFRAAAGLPPAPPGHEFPAKL